VETLFPPNRKHVNVILGQGTRAGKAARAYLVSGPWNFGSVLKHSTYIHTVAIIVSARLVASLPFSLPCG
jgi:hypothetical protein